MDMDRYEHGVPSWVDVGSPDVDRAAAFYTDLFGWDIPEGPPETGGYRIALLRGRTVCGVGPQMNPGPPVWMSYVNVDNADAIVPLVKDNGGAVFMEPMDVLDVGRMAVFADPAGAVFGIWQPGTHPGAGVVNEPGSLTTPARREDERGEHRLVRQLPDEDHREDCRGDREAHPPPRSAFRAMTLNAAPVGSVTTANRPGSMSIGPMRTEPSSSLTLAMHASVSPTAK